MKKTDAFYNGQSFHITVGYHKFPPTQHLLRHNWINESKMRKRTQKATATTHTGFFFPSFLTPRSNTFSDASTGVSWQENFCTEECAAGHWPRLLSAQSADEGKDIFWLQRSPSSLPPHLLACVLLHAQVILQDHLSTVHISAFWLHNN